MNKQLFEAVDVKTGELPEPDAKPFENYSIKVLGVNSVGRYFKCQYGFDFKQWYSEEGEEISPPVKYLIPTTLTDVIKEVAEMAWEAGQKRLKHEYPDAPRSAFDWQLDEKNAPDKTEFINSLITTYTTK